MKLTPMRFRDYVWPHNPRVYEIGYRRQVAAHKIPMGDYILQDMGRSYRVLKGEGEFAGEGAYEQFKKLASLFYQGGPGLLIHPVWQSASAYLVKLALKQEPREAYVAYTFEFWEDMGTGRTAITEVTRTAAAADAENQTQTQTAEEAAWYTVTEGDTLWAIAQRKGCTLSQLLALNPTVRNPNLIHPGDRVRVA